MTNLVVQHQLLVAWGADVRDDPATWTWYPIHDDVEWIPYTVKDGRSEGATQAETLSVQPAIEVRNPRGDYTPEDARAKYWPGVVEGTPVWWTLTTPAGTNDLVQGFVAGLAPRWSARNGRHKVVDMQVYGRLGLLNRGNRPLPAPLARSVLATSPVAYWPLTDGEDSDWAASGLPEGTQMDEAGTIQFAQVDGPAGAQAKVPELVTSDAYTGDLTAPVVMTTSTGWTVEGWVRGVYDTTSAVNGSADPVGWQTFGSPRGTDGWAVRILASPTFDEFDININAFDGSTTTTVGTGAFTAATFQGIWHQWRITATQNGGNVEFRAWVNGVQNVGVTTVAGSVGTVTRHMVAQPPARGDAAATNWTSISVAHFAAWDTPTPDLTYEAGLGWPGETPGERIERVCEEEGVPVSVDAATETTLMGAQPPGTLVDVVQDAELTGMGRLSERAWGLHYRPRELLYNQSAALVLDVDEGELGDPFAPRRDLAMIRNEVQVTRRGGSTATYRDTESQQRGVFQDSYTISPSTDAELLPYAQARVGIGTVEGYRCPSLSTDLGRHPELLAEWLALALGDRIQVHGARRRLEHAEDLVDQLVEGRVQTLDGRRSWKVTMVTSPAAPYTVGVIEGTGGDSSPPWRLDATAEITQVYGAGATSLSVATTEGPLLSTSAGDYPCDVTVDGVPMRVTAVSGASSPQTVTVIRGIDGWDRPLQPATAGPGRGQLRLWRGARTAL